MAQGQQRGRSQQRGPQRGPQAPGPQGQGQQQRGPQAPGPQAPGQQQRGGRAASARGGLAVVGTPEIGDQRQRALGRRARQRAAAAQQVKRRRLFIGLGVGTVVVVIAIVVVAFVLGNSSSGGLADPNALNPAANTLSVGTTAPDFNLATIDGKHYSLSAQRGHPVLLEFFAVWCPHCQHEAPILNNIEKAYGPKGLRALAILANPYGRNYDLSGGTDTRLANAGDIQWFQHTFSVTHPMLIDPTFATVNQYGAGSYPTIYVLDGKGVIRYVNQGDQAYSDLAKAVVKAGA